MDELVSIITPCYNGEKYLVDYFKGILSQDYEKIELIFVNDGSDDNTEIIAKKYGQLLLEKGVKYTYLYQENSGVAAAFNKALPMVNGEFVTWIDSDDIALHDNISKKVDYLRKHADCGFVQNEIMIVEESDKEKIIGFGKRIKPDTEDNFFEDLLLCNNVNFVPGTVMVRRNCLNESIPKNQIYENRKGQNWQLLLPLAYMHKCGYIEEPLLKCVSHSGSISRTKMTIDGLIKVENDYIDICVNTILNIPTMSDSEKKRYSRMVRVYHNKIKLFYYVKKGDYKNYASTLNELAMDGYKRHIKEVYFLRRIWLLVKSLFIFNVSLVNKAN